MMDGMCIVPRDLVVILQGPPDLHHLDRIKSPSRQARAIGCKVKQHGVAMCRADALSDLLGNAPKAVDAMPKDANGESGGVSYCSST